MSYDSSSTVAPIPASEVIDLCVEHQKFLLEQWEIKKCRVINMQRRTLFSRFFDRKLSDEELFEKRVAPGTTSVGMHWKWYQNFNYFSALEISNKVLALANLAKRNDEDSIVYLSIDELSELQARTYY